VTISLQIERRAADDLEHVQKEILARSHVMVDPMPVFSSGSCTVRFPDNLDGMAPSSLLLYNMNTFTVTILNPNVALNPRMSHEIFLVESTDYRMQLLIDNKCVRFRRGSFEACRSIEAARRKAQIICSWRPDQFCLTVLMDDRIGDNPYECVDTGPIFVPQDLLQWARRQTLTERRSYKSGAEFLSVISDCLNMVGKKIEETKAFSLFWDFPRQRANIKDQRLALPKRETQTMAGIRALLQDQSLLLAFDVSAETQAGPGILDMKLVAPLEGGGLSKIALEGKRAHSTDLEHGLEVQLPTYMRSINADHGIYLVLWFRCAEFDQPTKELVELTWHLTTLAHGRNITVKYLDLSRTPNTKRTQRLRGVCD
jgi:hypothetical protein